MNNVSIDTFITVEDPKASNLEIFLIYFIPNLFQLIAIIFIAYSFYFIFINKNKKPIYKVILLGIISICLIIFRIILSLAEVPLIPHLWLL